MKTKAILTALFLATTTLQAQNFEWAKSFGGSSDDGGNSITVDASGNVYTTGWFQGTVDFDPGAGTAVLTSAIGRNCYVQKLDSFGNFIWAKYIGGGVYALGYSITIDDSGNVYVTGNFQGTVDFDPGAEIANLSSVGFYDAFVLKLNASGNFLWAKSFGGSFRDRGQSISIDPTGNVYTMGYFEGTVDFDPGAGSAIHSSAGALDVFVQKLDSSGIFLWAKSFGGSSNEVGLAIVADASGNVYTTGHFKGIVDFDPGAGTANHTSAGASDVFVQKLDSSGNFLWVKSFGGSSEDIGKSLSVDPLGNVYTTGYFQGEVDFGQDTGTANQTSAGAFDVFVLKLDTSGSLLWVKSFGGTSDDIGNSVIVDASGNAYTTGYFFGTVDFDPGTGTANQSAGTGGTNVFIQKLDASGNFLWAKSFGGNSNDRANSIMVDASGNVYTTGHFFETADFDPGAGKADHNSMGDQDVFIQKLSPCATNIATDVITACDSYTWINGITYTTSNNTATYTLTNTEGCDSTVNLNLTINLVANITVSTSGLTITANNAGAAYQWLDCEKNYAFISGEIGQAFTATANGSYAVELTENGCVDTSACVTIKSVGILDNTLSQTILAYPNPTSGTFTIDVGRVYESTRIKITDSFGRVVHRSNNISTSTVQILFNEPKGIYFLEVTSDDKTTRLKLIKK